MAGTIQDKALQLALDGKLTEQQAIDAVADACDNPQQAQRLLESLAVSTTITASQKSITASWQDMLKALKGNGKLLSAVVALLLTTGTLNAYTVKKGDTLWKLAGGTQPKLQQLLRLNPQLDPDKTLAIGTKIALPSEMKTNDGTYKVQKGDTLSSIAKKNGTTVEQLLKDNPSIKDPDLIRPGQELKMTRGDQQAEKDTGQQPATTVAQQEQDFIARTIYAESGNDAEEMQLIARVIANRAKSPLFPNSPYEATRQPRQFSCTSGTDGNVKWKNFGTAKDKGKDYAVNLAKKVMDGDTASLKGTDDILFYCTKSLARKGEGINPESDGLDGTYGHPKGWGTYYEFIPVATSKNHVFYSCKKK